MTTIDTSTGRHRIAVWLTHPCVDCWRFNETQRDHLMEMLPGVDVVICPDEETFVEELPRCDIVMVWRFRQEWFALAPGLRWISTPAAGKDYFNVELPETVRITYGAFHGELMSETVIGMILAMVRGILSTDRLVRGGNIWPRQELAPEMRPLRGSHLVILGFGRIGESIGRLAKAFGVRITGVRRSKTERPGWFEETDRVVTISEFDSLLPEVDHLVVCLPRTPETDQIIDESRLRKLPAHATLCNVGRGNAIDEDALGAVLREGGISAACLDVFSEEPVPANFSLRECPNLLLMPHASAIAPNYLDLYLGEFVSRFREFDLTPER